MDISKKLKGCVKEVSKVSQVSFKGIQGSFKVFFMEVSRVFQESFKGTFIEVKGWFKNVL